MRSGTVVCPAYNAAFMRRGLYGVRGSDPNRFGGMLDSPAFRTGFSAPVSLTFCPYVVFRPSRTSRAHPRIMRSRAHPRSPAFLFQLVCGTPPFGASKTLTTRGMRSGTVVCPAYNAAFMRRGPFMRRQQSSDKLDYGVGIRRSPRVSRSMVGRARFGTSSCIGRAAICVPTFYPAGSVSLRDPYPDPAYCGRNVPRVGPKQGRGSIVQQQFNTQVFRPAALLPFIPLEHPNPEPRQFCASP